MKKILSAVLAAAMLMSAQISVFAEASDNYEYILPMNFYRIDRLKNGYLVYDTQEKCALYDLDGKKISDDYDYIGAFYKDDVGLARKDGKYYVINSRGEVLSEYDKRVLDVSQLVFVNLTDENEDGRPISYFEGEFAVYNYWGELLTVLPYEKYMPPKNSGMALSFSGGYLNYKENGKWGALGLSFRTAIEPEYDKIYPFNPEQCGVTIARKDIKYGLINTDGTELTDFAYDAMEMLWCDGKFNGYRAVCDDKYTLFDKKGNAELKDVDAFVPNVFYEDYGLVEVYIPNTREDGDEYPYLYGLIDTDVNVVVPIEHITQFIISDGMITAEKSYDHMGYYDLNGNPVTDFKYRMASPFSGGLACVSGCIGDVWSHEVINKNGEVVFYTDGWCGGFRGGIADVGNGTLINKKGEVVIKNDAWEQILWLGYPNYNNDGCFSVRNGELNGVVRYKGYISPWAENEVEKALEIGIVNVEGNYDYVKPITREAFCELIYNYCTSVSGVPTAVYAENPFADTENSHISVLNALGIIKGKSETEFAPNDLLTREEAATIISRLIKTVHSDTAATELWYEFTDGSNISDWAVGAVQHICNMGIMSGVGDNKFAPEENFTTEQAIATLVRSFEKCGQNEIIGSGDAETDITVSD